MAALRLAWQHRADGSEFAVCLSQDGPIAVMYDSDTRRTAGVDKKVKEQTLAALRQRDVGQWKGEQFAGEKIPTLAAMLAAVPAGKKVSIEGALTGDLARTNYVACYGNTPFLGEDATVPGQHLVIIGISGGGVFYRNSRTRIADITDGLTSTFLAEERSALNSMSTWVGVIPGAQWQSINDSANYGSVPSNLATSLVLGHACRDHPPSTPNGVAEDFSSQHANGINVLPGDGSVHSVHEGVNMSVYPFTASIADGKALVIDF